MDQQTFLGHTVLTESRVIILAEKCFPVLFLFLIQFSETFFEKMSITEKKCDKSLTYSVISVIRITTKTS